jgi:UDP-glucose 4-epimerase
MKKYKVIVFGGSGFLGSHVCDKLTDDGHEVFIFDKVVSPFLNRNQVMLQGDILDKDLVQASIKNKDIVYNFAGYADLDSADGDPINTTQLNLIGNLHILEACKNSKVLQFIYASTIYVYSENGGFYRCSKQAAEIYIEEYNRKFNLNYTILRYGTLYGPRADERNSIYRYILNAIEKNSIHVNADGSELREYVHVRDAAKISARILNQKFYGKRFVITGHQAIPVKQMISMIQEILKKKINIKYSHKHDSNHYKITPYSFVPKIGEKFSSEIYTDMGQGLIECMADYYEKRNLAK